MSNVINLNPFTGTGIISLPIGIGDVTGLQTALDGKIPLVPTPTAGDLIMTDSGGNAIDSTISASSLSNILNGGSNVFTISQITNLQTILNGLTPMTRIIATEAPLQGGGDLSADRTLTIDTFDGTNTGAVPASGNDSTVFLRGDGEWRTPPGSGGVDHFVDLLDIHITAQVDGTQYALTWDQTNSYYVVNAVAGNPSANWTSGGQAIRVAGTEANGALAGPTVMAIGVGNGTVCYLGDPATPVGLINNDGSFDRVKIRMLASMGTGAIEILENDAGGVQIDDLFLSPQLIQWYFPASISASTVVFDFKPFGGGTVISFTAGGTIRAVNGANLGSVYSYLGIPNAAPSDGDISVSQVSQYIDETVPALKWRAKESDNSTYVTFTLPVLGSIATQNANNVNITGGTITGMPSPTSSTDVANKAYVDAISTGVQVKPPARLATTAALPANSYANGTLGVGATITASGVGILTIDTKAVVLNDRILVKDEGIPNGIYVCTTEGTGGVAFILTRATDNDQASEFPGAQVAILDGSVNKDGLFLCVNTSVTVGTDTPDFIRLNTSVTVSPPLNISGNNITVNNNGITDAFIRQGAGLSVIGVAGSATANVADIVGTANGVLQINAAGTVLSFAPISGNQISNHGVGRGKLTQGDPLSVVGVAGAVTADVADIDASAADQVLRVNSAGTVLAFGPIATGGITNNAVTYAKVQQGTALSVLGVTGNATANLADIVAGSDFQVLRRSGTSVGFGTVATGGIADNAVTLAKVAQGTALSVLGVTGNATANYADMVAGTDGNVMRRSGTAIGFGQINLAATGAVTGQLPTANVVNLSGTNTGDQTITLSGAVTGSGTAGITTAYGTLAGLSVLGVTGSSTAVPAAIVGTANQALVVNSGGTGLGFGAVNLASSAAITGLNTSTTVGEIAYTTQAFGASITPAVTAKRNILSYGTMTGATTFNNPGAPAFGKGTILEIWITQDSTGGRLPTFDSGYAFGASPGIFQSNLNAIYGTPNAQWIMRFMYDGTSKWRLFEMPILIGLNPPDVGTILQWIDASQLNGYTDGQSITTVNELSGTGSQYDGTGLTYKLQWSNGQPAIAFAGGGSNGLISHAAYTGIPTTFTHFLVYQRLTNPGQLIDVDSNNAPRIMQLRYNNSATALDFIGLSTVPNAYTATATVGGFQPTIIVAQRTSSAVTLFDLYGAQLATTASAGTNNSGNHKFCLGNIDGGGNAMVGYIGEWIMYSGVVTSTGIGTVLTYLRNKWGIF